MAAEQVRDGGSREIKDADPRIAQTLDRGLQVMELLAARRDGLTIAQISSELGVGRTIARRLITTLHARRLVTGPVSGAYRLGIGIIELSRHVEPDLRSIAEGVLEDLAEETRATAHLSVRDGNDVVVFMAIEPRNTRYAITWHGGTRHPINLGSAGIALRSIRPPEPDEPPSVIECREQGWAISRGSMDAGATGIAVPVDSRAWNIEAAVGIVTTDTLDEDSTAKSVLKAAQQLRKKLDA